MKALLIRRLTLQERETGRRLYLAWASRRRTIARPARSSSTMPRLQWLVIAFPVLCVAGLRAETLSFSRDVVPVLTKAGCNSGACRGSFQGRGGLQLSLLGFRSPGRLRHSDEDGPRATRVPRRRGAEPDPAQSHRNGPARRRQAAGNRQRRLPRPASVHRSGIARADGTRPARGAVGSQPE